MYPNGASIRQVPEFGTSKHYGKPMEVYSSGQMIWNYNVCCWPTSLGKILIVDYDSVRGLKVTYCIVQSAKYWCPYGTSVQILLLFGVPLFIDPNKSEIIHFLQCIVTEQIRKAA